MWHDREIEKKNHEKIVAKKILKFYFLNNYNYDILNKIIIG